ncbi:uncharacterized protein LOC142177282 [Nicotiana tabacum]|uniref:Uncharacterized protein LOC142177282 n=1 Tax=Nicotiana tabacum TaxID=4097 RepID=A0AC58TXB5_TOBAC
MDSSLSGKQFQDVARLEKFNGMNYKRWSMKMMYQLTIAKVYYVLTCSYPQDGKVDGQLSDSQQKWLEDDFVCRSMIPNAMSNALFNVFHKCYPAYELWVAISRRYVIEDAGNRSFLINKYINFKMDDSKPVIDQVNELNKIVSQCADVDYHMKLKHKTASLNLDQLLQHIQIEYEARNRDLLVYNGKDKVHNIENFTSSKSAKTKVNKFHNGNKTSDYKKRFDSKNGISKKNRGHCFVCGKMGHLARVCKFRKGKKGKKEEANVMEQEEEMVDVLTEILMMHSNEEWWLDSGATCHITPFKSGFKTYEDVKDEKTVYMGNSATCAVMGIGTMQLPHPQECSSHSWN